MPLELGGDDSSVDALYKFLRSALGDGGTSESEQSIDGLRLSAIALGMAAANAFDERAAMQAFPSLAIDATPAYEEILGIVPGVNETDHERRQETGRRWTTVQSSELPTLTAELKEIDPRFSVLDTSWSKSKTSEEARAFEAYQPGADVFRLGPDGIQTWASYPNYSDRDLVFALFDIGAGVLPGPPELSAIRRALDLLDDALPAWNEGDVITEFGFFTASSLTGYAGVDGS